MIVIMLSCLIYGYIHWEIVEASKKESPDCETVPHFYTKLPTCVTVIWMYCKVLLNHLKKRSNNRLDICGSYVNYQFE